MIEKWRDELILDRQGKIWWYNFQYDLRQSNLSTDIDECLKRAIEESLNGAAGKTDPLGLLIDVLKKSPADFDLKGKQVKVTEPLSRVIDAESFALYHYDYMNLGLETAETLTTKVWKMFREGNIDPERRYRGELRSGRNFFWGTLARRLDEVFERHQFNSIHNSQNKDPENKDLAATEIRNLLGLSYIEDGVGLYRIDIPLELLPEGHIFSPTTLDSSPYCVFLPANNNDCYGLTLHLSKLEPGAEEVVIKPIPLTKDCKVIQIGFVRKPLPNSDELWSTMEQIVERRLRSRPLKRNNRRLLSSPERRNRRRRNG